MSTTKPPDNLGMMFFETVSKHPHSTLFFHKVAGEYHSISRQDAWENVSALVRGFKKMGLLAGDTVAILSENRPQWAYVDLACQCLGVATVPIYTSLTPGEIAYLLSDARCKLVAVSTRAFAEKVAAIQRDLPALGAAVFFDAAASVVASSMTIPTFLIDQIIKENISGDDVMREIPKVSSDSIASIIYTSGTTGKPKGVMLSHNNFISNVSYCKQALKMSHEDKHLSFLPLSHVFERMAGHYLMIYIGASIAYAENMDTVSQNMIEIKPTFILGVPRFFEKIKDKITESISQASPNKKNIFSWAQRLGQKKRKGEVFSVLENLQMFLAKQLVYKKIKTRLGGRVRFCVSGGAPLSKEIAEFFCDLDILILEGYGLSETSPVISVNRMEKFCFGSVGVPLAQVQVKICDDGEIATKSDSVMRGYLNKPEETAAVLKDGWFYTGDLGEITPDGFLKITGRKKELIVTSGGKKVSPRPIEEMLEADPLILRCVLFGEGKKYITALIIPRKDPLIVYAQQNKIAYSSYEELLENPAIYRLIDALILEKSCDLASYERIKYFILLENDFSQVNGELTPTLKVKRDVVLSRHKERLLALYSKTGE